MSPLVWDLAHIGQQEELWLLRDGNPDRPGMLPPDVDRLYDAFVHSRASRVELPLLPPADARTYCATVRDRALDNLDALPDDDGGRRLPVRAGDQPREPARRDDAAGAEPAVRAAAVEHRIVRCRPAGRESRARPVLVPAGEFILGVDAVSEPHSLDNERPAHVVDVAAFRIGRVPVTNGEWRQFIDDGGYRAAALVVGPRLDASAGGGADRAAVLESRRHPHPLRARRGDPRRRTGAARHLLRGRGVRGVGRRAPAHRGGVGKGRRLGPRERASVADSLGAHRNPPNTWRILAVTRCAPPRSVPTRQARQPMAPSRCWATCGSGRHRRCGRGRASRR